MIFVLGMLKQMYVFVFTQKTALMIAINKIDIVAILSILDVCFKIILN